MPDKFGYGYDINKLVKDYKRGKKMAKRKRSSKKSKSNTPAVRHLRYQLTNSDNANTETSHFFDLFRDLSLVNRRLYRQGKHLFIKKITVTSRNTDNGLVSVSTAPTSWIVEAAWKKAFRLWTEMRKGHGGAPGSGLPRGVTPATWADFKVYLSNDHRTATMPLPLDNGNNAVSVVDSEWVYARFISPDGTAASDEFTAHLLGPNVGAVGAFTSVGVVKGYAESRRSVEEDDSGDSIDTDSWMVNLFDDGTTLDEIAEDLKADGDLPPYALQQYAGGGVSMPKPVVQQMKSLVQSAAGATNAPSITLGGVQAPCGLLEVEISSSVPDDVFDVLIEIAQGDYKGVKALPM